MKSPFPGMDPYIEDQGLWGDFHLTLMSEIDRTLATLLPPRYCSRIGKREYVELEGLASDPLPERETGGDPVTMQAFRDEDHREYYLEIREHSPDNGLVTRIEMLSPANKRPGTKGRELYLRKRNSLLLGSVNFVEIDLVRAGQRMPMVQPWPKCPYYLLVARADFAPSCRVWPAHYRLPLPEIPVPLAPPDADLTLALQPLIEATYPLSRNGDDIDYAKPLANPLPLDDTAWLRERLRIAEN